MDGETLRSLIEAARARGLVLGLREVCFIVQQVAEGLSHAPGARAGYRGLHPSHVWISRRGEVRLMESGGASRYERSSLAPEQVRGLPATERSDVFRLGLILYELLARRPLFDEAHPQVIQLIGAFDERDLKPLPGCPPSLWTVLFRSLAAAPQSRFPSVHTLASTLGGFLRERQLRVEQLDLAHLFARVFPERCSPVPPPVAPVGVWLEREPVTVPCLAVPPPPPKEACEEGSAEEHLEELASPRLARLLAWHARLLDEALGLIGDSAELAPLLVRLTRGCVVRLGGGEHEELLAVTAARTLAIAARSEESRRFVLPTPARVQSLAGGLPEVGEILSAVLLARRDQGAPAGCAARALLCAAAFVIEVQCAEPGATESARAFMALRQDRRIEPATLEALAAELLGVAIMPRYVASAGGAGAR